jgi:hypothetical protein
MFLTWAGLTYAALPVINEGSQRRVPGVALTLWVGPFVVLSPNHPCTLHTSGSSRILGQRECGPLHDVERSLALFLSG